MCQQCWEGAGSPANWNAQIAEALQLTRELYAIHPTGGPLHTVLEDCNIDGTIEPYYDGWVGGGWPGHDDLDALFYDGIPIAELDPLAPAVVEGLGRSTRQICDELAALLNTMPESDRYAMLAYHDGLIEVPHG